jgi:tetratricopeptide (TPR) repeat protein
MEKILEIDPSLQLTVDIQFGHISLLRGNLDQARIQYHKEPEGSSSYRYNMANLNLLQGKFMEAEKEFLKKPILRESLAVFYLRTGRSQRALEEFIVVEEAAKKSEIISAQIRAQYAQGIALAQMKSFDEASKIAENIHASIPSWMHKKLMRYHDHLLGKIAFERGNISESIPYLNQAVQSLYAPDDNMPKIQSFFIYTLAEAYSAGGNLAEAQRELEKILSLHLGRIGEGDYYAKSLYMLGKIFAQQGQTEKAIQHFRRFVNLWKDADPDLPELKDARSRLSRLE